MSDYIKPQYQIWQCCV